MSVQHWLDDDDDPSKPVLSLQKDGMGILKIRKTLGVGTSVVQGPFEAGAAA
jgi:hypothetical protein